MANVDIVKGAVAVKHPSGNLRTSRYAIPANNSTAVYMGDFVKSEGSATTDGVPHVIQAAAGNLLRGVVVGFEPDHSDLTKMYRVGSTLRYCQVADDPATVFEIQADGSTAADDVGENADIVVASGNTTSGNSGMELQSSSHVTSTAQLRILGFVQRPDNEIGANAKLLVRINEHELVTVSLAGM